MNYTISMTDILLAVSVGCNLWFLFLLLYERIMDTRIVRFFKGIVGLWRSLDGNEAKRIAAHEEVPAEKAAKVFTDMEGTELYEKMMEGSSEIGIRIKGLIEIRLKKSEKEFVVPDNIEEFDIRNYV